MSEIFKTTATASPETNPLIAEIVRQQTAGAELLDPPGAIRREWMAAVFQHGETYLSQMLAGPAYGPAKPPPATTDPFISETTGDLQKALAYLRENVDHQGVNIAAGGNFSYIPGGGVFHAALGDYLAAITNRYAGVHFGGPGAAQLETDLLDWLAAELGFPKSTAGDLTSGGSIANLSAIIAAREAANIRSANIAKSVVYLTRQTHHCISKALRIAGLAECPRRYVEIDEHYRMQPERLADLIAADRSAGLRPCLVVASAGTTDTGAIDPLSDIADISAAENLWFHIDGAYGAIFALSDLVRPKLKGLSRADSLVVDPHKGLFLPFGSGVVLVKDGQKLYQAFQERGDYMQDVVDLEGAISPSDFSPELSKHFRGLRMWLPLKLAGVAPFRAALTEKYLLAQYFHQKLSENDRFEVGPQPDLSLVIYRYLPRRGDSNDFNRKLFEAIKDDGRIFVSSTAINGTVYLRLAILSFRSHLPDVEMALAVIPQIAGHLEDS